MATKTKVVNRHFESYNIYIGRGTKWGNPFKIGIDGTREEVMELYRQYAKNNPDIYNNIEELRGKRLGCSCKPQLCHGDVLLELLKGEVKLKYNKIVVGIDQSYTRTGISIAADGELLKVASTDFSGISNKSKTCKRRHIAKLLTNILSKNIDKAAETIIICERIRTFSQGHLSTNYLISTGALVATIVDTAYDFGVPVYSVDTRSWKAQVVGSAKGNKTKGNKYKTIEYVQNLGFDLYLRTNKKGDKIYDDDAADSACIALYGFIPQSNQKLKIEN